MTADHFHKKPLLCNLKVLTSCRNREKIEQNDKSSKTYRISNRSLYIYTYIYCSESYLLQKWRRSNAGWFLPGALRPLFTSLVALFLWPTFLPIFSSREEKWSRHARSTTDDDPLELYSRWRIVIRRNLWPESYLLHDHARSDQRIRLFPLFLWICTK